MNIENIVKEKKNVLVTKSRCTYCDLTKIILNRMEKEYYIVDIEKLAQNEKQELMTMLYKKYRHRTFPAVFIDGNFLGGYTELMKEEENLNSL